MKSSKREFIHWWGKAGIEGGIHQDEKVTDQKICGQNKVVSY